MLPLLGEVVAWRDSEKFFSEVRKMLATTVGDAMTGQDKLVTIHPEVSLQECAQIMCRCAAARVVFWCSARHRRAALALTLSPPLLSFLRKRITRLPVLDADKRLVGIISRTDIVRILAAHPDNMLPL